MRTRPADLHDDEVAAAVTAGWGVDVRDLRYVPEGGGSHHWKATDDCARRWFVTVDDLDTKPWLGEARDEVFEGLRGALGTAAQLHHAAGLDSVVAPVPCADGEVVRRLDGRYAISVFPFLTGTSYPYGQHLDPRRRAEVLRIVIAVHGATATVGPTAPRHRPTFGGRAELESFLEDPGLAWDAGPYGEPARRLLHRHQEGLAAVLAGFDHLVERTSEARAATVLTHGEPHPANFMSVGGRMVLIDWDTVALAPAERDLWIIDGGGGDEISRYEQATGRRPDPAVMSLYGLRWYLDDIASTVRQFRRAHGRTEDARHRWDWLEPLLSELPTRRDALA